MATRVTPCVPALYSFLLGSIFSGSLFIAILKRDTLPNLSPISVYLSSLALFHFLEYFWQAKYHPETTTSEAFLLNHSKEYLVAIIIAVTEFSIRRCLGLSPVWIWIQFIGIILIISGILLRSLAMIYAASNFSHDIRNDLSKDHKLVFDGVYAFCRHPSYLGFFAFAVGGQVILGNLITTIIFVFVLQKFFRERIAIEEAILLRQYPIQYSDYKKKIWSGIPFNSD